MWEGIMAWSREEKNVDDVHAVWWTESQADELSGCGVMERDIPGWPTSSGLDSWIKGGITTQWNSDGGEAQFLEAQSQEV